MANEPLSTVVSEEILVSQLFKKVDIVHMLVKSLVFDNAQVLDKPLFQSAGVGLRPGLRRGGVGGEEGNTREADRAGEQDGGSPAGAERPGMLQSGEPGYYFASLNNY